jgi:hypothetical protein
MVGPIVLSLGNLAIADQTVVKGRALVGDWHHCSMPRILSTSLPKECQRLFEIRPLGGIEAKPRRHLNHLLTGDDVLSTILDAIEPARVHAVRLDDSLVAISESNHKQPLCGIRPVIEVVHPQ